MSAEHPDLSHPSRRHVGAQPDRLLRTPEAAELLNVSVAFLERQRWLRAGPPHVRVSGASGRAVRYRRSDLLSWMEANRIDSSSD
ncbi:helix-turn-helix transcriptional regulator [Phenylobacterium sp.]|jgi:excisionase family DNA binding protein|uniref:helix-turn-helix transcriptional regulator n=1 Tax=Phenylobacterium sp. TaxID=1871053 RepID=UPI0039C9523D